MSSKINIKPKSGLLTERGGEKNKTQVKDIVKQVQTIYSKFEKGEVDHRRLTKVIVDDLKAGSVRFETIIKSAKEDKKDFKNIMKSLDIFHRPTNHPGFSNEEIKTSTEKKFPRYIRHKAYNSIVTPMHTGTFFLSHLEGRNKEQLDSKKNIKKSVDNFAKGYIDTNQFETELKQGKVNPQMEEINKHIRSASTGGHINYKDLMCSVMKYKECDYGNVPNKWNYKSRQLNNFDHRGYENENNNFRSFKEREGQDPEVLKKRKTVDNDPNYASQREVFEWNTCENFSSNQSKEIFTKERGAIRDKFIHKGRVMLKENDLDKLFTYKMKSSKISNGNILEWNETDILKKRRTQSLDFDNMKKNQNLYLSNNTDSNQKRNSFKKKDPNWTMPVNVEQQVKPKPTVKKVNALLYESNSFPLKYK